jgi:hypothetical protein
MLNKGGKQMTKENKTEQKEIKATGQRFLWLTEAQAMGSSYPSSQDGRGRSVWLRPCGMHYSVEVPVSENLSST